MDVLNYEESLLKRENSYFPLIFFYKTRILALIFLFLTMIDLNYIIIAFDCFKAFVNNNPFKII